MGPKKPVKKTTAELFEAIDEALENIDYYFSDHGEKRSKSRRKVGDLEVIKILKSDERRHEAAKDKYEERNADWNYHIRGKNCDDERIRIALSFDEDGMVIITVINLDEEQYE